MAEEIVPVEGQQNEQIETPEVDPIEQRAIEMGWRPKEEFEGDEVDFIDAKEFVRRAPLFEKIEHQGKQLKNAVKALEAFKDHYSKVKETEYHRAIADLKLAWKNANREGDFDRADVLERHVERIEAEAQEFKQEQQAIQVEEPAQSDPRFVNWTNRNPWYNSQPHMRVFADDYGLKLARQGTPPQEVLKLVEEAVKKEFPTKFRNPNKDSAPAVEGSTNKGSSRKDSFEMTEQEQRIMKTLTSGPNPTMTKEKYIADLKAIKGLK